MKKYLMTGIAAVAMCAAFTSCSHDMDFEGTAQQDQVQSKYDQAFLNYVGGKIDPNQDWGFSATRGITRSNSGETYPATHTYANGGANCNANEWANPNKEFGGWVVPIPLTPKQKEIVIAYFQSKPDIGFEDPQLRHFFVQQVYKGGPETAGANSTEVVTAADGKSTYTSDNMNQLTVGQSNMHINNFNGGTCTPNTNVLQNDGTTTTDQIMLMVNVDDTSCFGYHDSGSSDQPETVNHNDKAALVSWQTIRTWANAHGYNGELLNDGYDRSFMGFDLAIKEGSQAYATDNSGNVLYADYSQAPTSPVYGWDGTNIVEMGTFHTEQPQADNPYYTIQVFDGYKDEYKNIFKVTNTGTEAIGWLTTNENFYVAEDKITLTDEYSNGEIPQSALNDEALRNVLVFKDVQVPGAVNNKAHVINLKRIKELVDAGYLPIKDKSLTEWVKVGVSDGVFSDWIVTLTEAKRQVVEQYDLKIIAEDLTAQGNSDFDFNDVVLEVKYGTQAKVKLTHAGGTLPLVIITDPNVQDLAEEIDETYEVHDLFGVGRNEMVNTGAGPNKPVVLLHELTTNPLNVSIANAAEANQKLRLFVYKEKKWHEMKAPKGEPACKLAVDTDYTVLGERVSIKGAYPLFVSWANGTGFTSKWWETTTTPTE